MDSGFDFLWESKRRRRKKETHIVGEGSQIGPEIAAPVEARPTVNQKTRFLNIFPNADASPLLWLLCISYEAREF